MFFLGDGQQSASRDSNKLTAELAKAFCRTLMPHLSKLCSDGCTCIGLRVNLDNDNVMYILIIIILNSTANGYCVVPYSPSGRFCVFAPSILPGKSSLASYFASEILIFKTPSP